MSAVLVIRECAYLPSDFLGHLAKLSFLTSALNFSWNFSSAILAI